MAGGQDPDGNHSQAAFHEFINLQDLLISIMRAAKHYKFGRCFVTCSIILPQAVQILLGDCDSVPGRLIARRSLRGRGAGGDTGNMEHLI